jgi:biopolymer transport protein ExbD
VRSPARHRPYHLQPNLTSLIDVVFLLLVFFLLATQLTEEKRVEMTLPALDNRESAPMPPGAGDTRIIVNVVPEARETELGGAYIVDKDVFAGDAAGIASLGERLRRARQNNSEVRVLLRAARNEHYQRVHPAMQAVTLAGVSGVDLVTVPPDGEIERLIEHEHSGVSPSNVPGVMP